MQIEKPKQIFLKGAEVRYMLRKSSRARHLRISITSDGTCTVTGPYFLKESKVEEFLIKKADWVLKVIDKFKKAGFPKPIKIPKKDIAQHKIAARKLAIERLAYFNKIYRFRYGKIQIRNQKTRWGSCTKQGNLNFNFKIALLPERQRDYIIVHELCHTKEFNHSVKFWALVAKTIPEYKQIRKALKGGVDFN
jgi:predicted metal-dependent hydrolase